MGILSAFHFIHSNIVLVFIVDLIGNSLTLLVSLSLTPRIATIEVKGAERMAYDWTETRYRGCFLTVHIGSDRWGFERG